MAEVANLPVEQQRPQRSVIQAMAERYGMEAEAFEVTVRATCSPTGKDVKPLTKPEFAAFLLVAKEYNLNPLTKEIYAFPKRGGGVVPVVSVDGWVSLVNSHSACDGIEFSEDHDSEGNLISCTCSIYRKDRSRPVIVTEYFDECYRATDPWKMKHRMLRHKALIQCARYAFGFSGIYDEDEAATQARQQTLSAPPSPPPAPPAAPPAPPPAAMEPMEDAEAEPVIELRTLANPKPEMVSPDDFFERMRTMLESMDPDKRRQVWDLNGEALDSLENSHPELLEDLHGFMQDAG